MTIRELKQFPIHFILGFFRSGTTLLMAYCRAHPEIKTGFEETNYLYNLLWGWENGWYANYAAFGFKKEDIDPILNESVELFIKSYYKQIAKLSGRKVAVLKHPLLTGKIDHLAKIFKKAKFLVVLRHPFDVVASVMTFRFKDGGQPVVSSPESENVSNSYLGTMTPLFLFKNRFPERIKFVKLEDFITQPIDVLKGIYAFFGVCHDRRLVRRIIREGSKKTIKGFESWPSIETTIIQRPKDKFGKLPEKDKKIIRSKLTNIAYQLGYSPY